MIPVIYILKGKFTVAWDTRKQEIQSQLEKGKELVKAVEERLSQAKASQEAVSSRLSAMDVQSKTDLDFEISQMEKIATEQIASHENQVASIVSVERQSLLDSLKNRLADKVIDKTKGKLLSLDLAKVNENYLTSLLKSVKFLN